MADKDTALPVKTEGDLGEKLQVRIIDGTTDAQMASVDSAGNIAVKIHGNDPAAADHIVKLSETGEVAVDGIYDVTNNTNPANIGLVAQERNAAAADSRQTMQPTAKRGSVDDTIVSLDVSLHDGLGNNFSEDNPLPVVLSESASEEVIQFKASSGDVVKDATDSNEYTVASGKKLKLWQYKASGSGKIKVEVATNIATAGYNNKFVDFSSTANPSISEKLEVPIVLAAGDKVKIIVTNKDQQSQSVYSTLLGVLFSV